MDNKGLMDAYDALSKAGDDMVAAFEKNSQGYGYKYASLQQFTGTVRRVLASRGLAIVQPIDYVNGEQILRTLIYYKGWHEPIVASVMPLKEFTRLADDPPEEGKKKQALHPGQKQGAGITYARKYAIQAILCLAPDETDLDLDNPKIAPKSAQKDEKKKEPPKKESTQAVPVVVVHPAPIEPEREKMLEGIRLLYKKDKGTIERVFAKNGVTSLDLRTCDLDIVRAIHHQINTGEIE